MDVPLLLLSLVLLCAGALLGALALWCRAGRSAAARFWVRRASFDQPSGFAYSETAVLAVLPLLAQLLVVAGLVVAVSAVDALRELGLGGLYAAAVIGETLLCLVVMLLVGYRSVMPLWVYPAWLRPTRAAEKQRIRAH